MRSLAGAPPPRPQSCGEEVNPSTPEQAAAGEFEPGLPGFPTPCGNRSGTPGGLTSFLYLFSL